MNRRLLLLTRSLDPGGSERQIVTLARALRRRDRAVEVAVFYPGGLLEDELRDAGVPLHHLDKKGRRDVAGFLLRLVRLVRATRPAVLHAYLPTANLAAILLKPIFPGLRIVWGVRASDMDLGRYDAATRWSYRAERRAARYADLIIANAHAGRDHAVANGFPADRTVVVPNGIDTERFRPDPAARRRVRAEWGIGETDILIGLAGRIDPMKGHRVFVEAAARLASEFAAARFVCVGGGAASAATELQALAERSGLGERLLWVPTRTDMAGVYSAFDIACSTSIFGEGFSNVVAEAMACARVCVATDVGDTSRIVGNAGFVTAPQDAATLAGALRSALALEPAERRALGEAARTRIAGEFGCEALATRTLEAIEALP
ncbi:MAG: glycosyltransferase [Alphaproteobacteria bacterium]